MAIFVNACAAALLGCTVVLAVALAGAARHLVASVFHADGDFGGLILVSFLVSTHLLVVDRVSFYGVCPFTVTY